MNGYNNYTMRTKYLLIAFCLALLTSSCDLELLESTNCSDCYIEKPADAYVDIKVTINNENPYVPIELYLGDFEKENLIYRDTATSATYTTILEMHNSYSVVAKYQSKSRIIYVVSGEKLRTKKDYDSCEEVCYTIKGDVIDVRLKE